LVNPSGLGKISWQNGISRTKVRPKSIPHMRKDARGDRQSHTGVRGVLSVIRDCEGTKERGRTTRAPT
jgi:hypothetical protein